MGGRFRPNPLEVGLGARGHCGHLAAELLDGRVGKDGGLASIGAALRRV